MNNINLQFNNPWLLLLLIPAVILALIPYLKIKKHRRRTRNRVVSMVLHIVILVLITLVFTNFKVNIENVLQKKDTIILVDVSDSNSSAKESIDLYLEDVLENYDNSNKVGIVTFGNEYSYVSKLSSNASEVYGSYKNAEVTHKNDATNMESALLYAKSLLSSKGGRIIVLTDGVETDGDAIATAKKLASSKIQIDAVFFNGTALENEVQINSIELGGAVILNDDTDVNVYLQSVTTGMATISLYDNDTLIGSQEVFVQANETIVTFTHQFESQGEHLLHAVCEVSNNEDTYNQNNEYYTFIDISFDLKVLVIDGTGNESDSIVNLIGSEYDTTVVNAADVSNDIEVLKEYSEIILMNASVSTLPSGFDETLKEYVALGGNLLTTGGTNTYYFGGMANTAFEEILPINIKKDDETPIAVMLVIDASGSMNDSMSGSTYTKLEIAKQAAIASVDAMRDCDFVGVIAFNTTSNVVLPLTSVSNKTTIYTAINSIKYATGTYYVNALNDANKELISFDKAEIKHVIFLSDGEPSDTGYKQYVSSLFEKGITTSTIAVDPSTANFSEELEAMAQIGGGNFYTVINALQLADIMVNEVESLQSDYLNEEEVTPRIKTHTSVVKGISSLPSITGYVGSTAKDEATIVLQANGDPLYAQWNYGNGTVGSFMSDLKGEWTQKYFSDERGIKFINNVVNNLLADSVITSDFSVTYSDSNLSKVLTVQTNSNNGTSNVEAIITYPNGDIKAVKLTLTSTDTYAGQIPEFGQAGLYKINLIKTSGSKETLETFYTTFSYSSEYDAFYDYNESYEFLENLVKSGKGSLYTTADNIFSNEILYDTLTYNPQLGLVIVALLLFLLDIVVRKFNFKWPHEIWGKKSKELKLEN